MQKQEGENTWVLSSAPQSVSEASIPSWCARMSKGGAIKHRTLAHHRDDGGQVLCGVEHRGETSSGWLGGRHTNSN